MDMANIDTRSVFKKLTSVGFSEKQAEAFLYGYNQPLNNKLAAMLYWNNVCVFCSFPKFSLPLGDATG